MDTKLCYCHEGNEFSKSRFVPMELDLKEFVAEEPRVLVNRNIYSDELDLSLKNYFRTMEYMDSGRIRGDQDELSNVDLIRKAFHDKTAELFIRDMRNKVGMEFSIEEARKEIEKITVRDFKKFKKSNRTVSLSNLFDIYEIVKLQNEILNKNQKVNNNEYLIDAQRN